MAHDDPNAPVAPPTSAGTGAILCGWAIWLAIMLSVALWTGAQLLSPGAPPDSIAAFIAPESPPDAAEANPNRGRD
jgi:hypothetical protein